MLKQLNPAPCTAEEAILSCWQPLYYSRARDIPTLPAYPDMPRNCAKGGYDSKNASLDVIRDSLHQIARSLFKLQLIKSPISRKYGAGTLKHNNFSVTLPDLNRVPCDAEIPIGLCNQAGSKVWF
jgi:hypothetical protein